MLSTYLTWVMLALIPVVPAVLALWPGLDEPRSSEEDAPAPARDDTRLDDPREAPPDDGPRRALMAA